MPPVTVQASSRNSYYSAGNIGWQAKSAFSYHTAVQQRVSASAVNVLNVSAQEAVGQSFTTVGAIDLTCVRVALQKTGSPTDNISVEIHADASDSPSGTPLATATNVYNGAVMSTVASWLEFFFSTPLALSASTKYWIVIQRSAAVDLSNCYAIPRATTSVYADGGRAFRSSGVWDVTDTADDLCFQILAKTPTALYQLAQDTGGSLKLRMLKSTDGGVVWTEQDASNAPTVTNGTYPFDGCDTRTGPYIGVSYFTATNTIRGRAFDMSADTWGTEWGSANASVDVSNERSIRIWIDNTFNSAAPGSQYIGYSSLADDADLNLTRRTTSTWSSGAQTASVNSTEASLHSAVVLDKSSIGFAHRFFYSVLDDDYVNRSYTTTTQGTATALSTAAADVETEHASACYQIYQNGSFVDTIVAAFIDAAGTIQERILTLEATSASVSMAADTAVSAATGMAGRQLTTCSYGGTRYIVFNILDSLIGYNTSTVAGTWNAGVNFLTALTNAQISNVLSIEGYGLGLAYTENGVSKFVWIVAPTSTLSLPPYPRFHLIRNNTLLRR